VIVKTLFCRDEQEATRVVSSAVREAKIATIAGSFPYVVRFFGACMPNADQLRETRTLHLNKLMFVYDRATDGSLDTHLVKNNKWRVTNIETETEWLQRQAVDPRSKPGPKTKEEQQRNLIHLLQLADSTAIALMRTHELGIIHADLAMRNVLVQRDVNEACGFKPLLTDFGLSKMIPAADQAARSTTNSNSAKSLLIFEDSILATNATRGCIIACQDLVDPVAPEAAPECRMFGVYSDKSDAYMFGALLCRLFLRGESLSDSYASENECDLHMYDQVDSAGPPSFAEQFQAELKQLDAYTCCPEDIVQLIIDLTQDCVADRCNMDHAHSRLQIAIQRENRVLTHVDPVVCERLLVEKQLKSCIDHSHVFLPQFVDMQMRMYVPLHCTHGRKSHDNDSSVFDVSNVLQQLLNVNRPCDEWTTAGLLSDVKELGSLQLDSSQRIRVILLEGIAGSGKTLTGWHMWSKALKQCDEIGIGSVVPVFISLPEYRQAVKSGTLMETLISRKFGGVFPHKVADVIRVLKEHARLLIILDGLDELNDKNLNVFEHNSLHEWRSSIVIISCRSGFLNSTSDITKCIAAAEGTLLHLELQPFDIDQRRELMRQYVSTHARLTANAGLASLQEFEQHLNQLPSLVESTTNPLNLFMMLEALPKLTATVPFRLDTDEFKLTDSPKNQFGTIRRCELYTAYLEQWMEREVSKLAQLGTIDDTPESRLIAHNSAMMFCQKLAFQMFLHDLTRIDMPQDKAADEDDMAGDMDDGDWSDDADNDSNAAGDDDGDGDDDDTAAAGVTASVPDTILLLLEKAAGKDDLRVSPVMQSGSVYSFMHKSIQEYLAALHVVNDVSRRCQHPRWGKLLQSEKRIGTMLNISQRPLLRDPAVLLFAAELVHSRGVAMQRYEPVDEKTSCGKQPQWPVLSWNENTNFGVGSIQPLTKGLFDLIEASKHHVGEHVQVAAANAMTILNYANVCFSGMDLSGIRLAHADLSQCVLNGVDLSGSRFHRTRVVDCDLDGAVLDGANLLEVDFGQLPMLDGHSEYVNCLEFDADSHTLFSGSDDNTIRMWNTQNFECRKVLNGHTDWVRSILLDTSTGTLYSGSTDKTIRVWDIHTGATSKVLNGHIGSINGLVLDQRSNMLYSCSSDCTIRVWDLNSDDFKCIRVLDGHESYVKCISIDLPTNTLFSGSIDRTVRMWDAATGQCLHIAKGHTRGILCCTYAADSRTLFSGAGDGTIRVWCVNRSKCADECSVTCTRTLTGHTGYVNCLVVDEPNHMLYSGAGDKTIRAWNSVSGECLKTFGGHSHWVRCLAIDQRRMTLYSGSDDSTVRIMRMSSSDSRKQLYGHGDWIRCLLLDSATNTLFSGSGEEDASIGLWDVRSGECLNMLHGHTSSVWCAVLDPTRRIVYSGALDNTIRMWKPDVVRGTGQCLHVLTGHEGGVRCLALHTCASRLYSGSDDASIRVWDAKTGACLDTLTAHTNTVTCMAFDSQRCRLFSGSDDSTIRVWDACADTLSCSEVLSGHKSAVICLVFDEANGMLYSGSRDETIRVWDMKLPAEEQKQDRCCKVLTGCHTSWIVSMALDSDAQILFSSSLDRTLHALDANTGTRIATLQNGAAVGNSVWCLAHDGTADVLYAGYQDKVIRAWNTKNLRSRYEYLHSLRGHGDDLVRFLYFDANTYVLYSRDETGTIVRWKLPPVGCDSSQSVERLEGSEPNQDIEDDVKIAALDLAQQNVWSISLPAPDRRVVRAEGPLIRIYRNAQCIPSYVWRTSRHIVLSAENCSMQQTEMTVEQSVLLRQLSE
jgi:WD40 repeat protein